jgi:hypothetical protein
MASFRSVLAAVTRPTNSRARPWLFFLLGVLCFLAGPAGYAAQLAQARLTAPWFVPALATLGLLWMVLSVLQRRGVFRTVGLVVFALVCGLEWFMMLVVFRTPPYEGPAQVGQKVPPFAAARADGTMFSDKDLRSARPTVLHFFRGRW